MSKWGWTLLSEKSRVNPCWDPRLIGQTTRSLANLPAGRFGSASSGSRPISTPRNSPDTTLGSLAEECGCRKHGESSACKGPSNLPDSSRPDSQHPAQMEGEQMSPERTIEKTWQQQKEIEYLKRLGEVTRSGVPYGRITKCPRHGDRKILTAA